MHRNLPTIGVLLVALFTWLALVPQAMAWNAVGHYLVAKVAFARLNEQERQKVIDILKEHPHYQAYLSADKPEGVSQEEWIFMRAAVWCDWVRPPRMFMGDVATHPVHKFHRGPWHYINYPYKKGQTDLTLGSPLPQEFNVQQQLPLSLALAKASGGEDPGRARDVTNAQNRAVRMCWLIHLVGDVHQPCHVTAWVDPVRLPQGDQGGNLTAIRVDIGAEPTRLHTWWDAMLGTDADPATVEEIAKSLAADPNLQPEKLPEAKDGDVNVWVQESFRLAVNAAYLNGELPFVHWDDYQSRAVNTSDVPILPVGAERNARTVARRQVVLAGMRLADKLREAIE
jgi:hypothetical protein